MKRLFLVILLIVLVSGLIRSPHQGSVLDGIGYRLTGRPGGF